MVREHQFACLLALSFLACIQAATAVEYAVVMDAGSSGTRVHIYRYSWTKESSWPKIHFPVPNKKQKPGLSSHAENPSAAATDIRPLIEFAESHVPAEKRGKTPILLGATAGLRLLTDQQQKDILASVEQELKKSAFMVIPDQIRVLQGREEGAFGWLAVQFLSKRLPGMSNGSEGTLGVLEMGGASTQVTALYDGKTSLPKKYSMNLDLGGLHVSLYTHSYLGYGQDAARRAYNKLLADQPNDAGDVEDPCLNLEWTPQSNSKPSPYTGPDGPTIIPTGDFSKCRELVSKIIDDKIACKEAVGCSFDGVAQPSLVDAKLLAFENYYYTKMGLGLTSEHVTPEDYVKAGQQFCSTPFPQVLEQNKDNKFEDHQSLQRYCFSAAYLSALMTKGFKLSEHHNVWVTREVNGHSFDWTMGMMLLHVAKGSPIAFRGNGGGFMQSMAAIILFGCAAALAWTLVQRRRMMKKPRSFDEEEAMGSLLKQG